jgi:hypothetical protein
MKNRTIDITLILHMSLLGQNVGKSYILDTGKQGSEKDKLSVYTEGDLLVFSAIDRTGIEYLTNASNLDLINSFHTLLFEIENSGNMSILSIYCDNFKIAFTQTEFPLIFTDDPFKENYFVGSDVMGHNHCNFEVAEQLVYGKVLEHDEKSKIHEYLKQKHFPQPKSKIRFTNGAYLYRDVAHNGLIQPVSANQPKYLNSDAR